MIKKVLKYTAIAVVAALIMALLVNAVGQICEDARCGRGIFMSTADYREITRGGK